MGRILSIRQPLPIADVVSEIRGHLYDAQGAKTKFNKHRLAAGQKLVELRARIEAGEAGEGVNWWTWFETADIGRSRKDAEKLMRMARSDDPEAAHESEKAENKAAYEKRIINDPTPDEYDIVEHAMNLVAKMSEDEREEFDQAYREKYDG